MPSTKQKQVEAIEADAAPTDEPIDAPIIDAPIVAFDYKRKESKKEILNVNLFNTLSCLNPSNPKTRKRLNAFVITLGAPDLPRRHSGVDHNYHPDKDIDQEWLDLLERGNTTLQYINRKSKKTCPNLIFLRGPLTKDDDPLTCKIHQYRTLDCYKSNIEAENQHAFEFHFAGHGTPDLVGPITHEKRLSPEMLATLFDQILEISDLKGTLLEKSKKQPLIFNFHTCNSAYVDLSNIDLTVPHADDAIKAKIRTESVIGKFYQTMLDLGYTDIKVIGYRGFYQSMLSGKGHRIVDSITNPTLDMDAANAAHSIENIKSSTVVTLAKSATFNVTLPITRPIPRHE